MKRKEIILLVPFLVFITITFIIFTYYLFFSNKRNTATFPDRLLVENRREKKMKCLEDGYFTNSSIDRIEKPKIYATIFIKDKETNEEIFKFKIDDVKNDIKPLETHKCWVYVIRNFERDETKNFYKRNELWRYDYSGKGGILMSNEEFRPYSFSFRIDDTETYIALIKSWYDKPENHALVIKNLKTMEDAYVITLKELVERYGVGPGTIQLSHWYNKNILSFEIIFPSESRPLFSLNSDTWKLERIETLEELMEAGVIGKEGVME